MEATSGVWVRISIPTKNLHGLNAARIQKRHSGLCSLYFQKRDSVDEKRWNKSGKTTTTRTTKWKYSNIKKCIQVSFWKKDLIKNICK